MTFNDVLLDIKKLIGLKLSSIRPGAEITILSVDEEQDNLVLMTSSGTKRSRPLRELRTIWELLLQNPVVFHRYPELSRSVLQFFNGSYKNLRNWHLVPAEFSA